MTNLPETPAARDAFQILHDGPRILRLAAMLIGPHSVVELRHLEREDGDAFDLAAADLVDRAYDKAGADLEREGIASALAFAVEAVIDAEIARGFTHSSREDIAFASGVTSLALRETTDAYPRCELVRDENERPPAGIAAAAILTLGFLCDRPEGLGRHEWCPVALAEAVNCAGVVFDELAKACGANPETMLLAGTAFADALDMAVGVAQRTPGRGEAKPRRLCRGSQQDLSSESTTAPVG